MAVIYETTHFLVQSAEFPLVDRNDGGHITLDPKFSISTRQRVLPVPAIELMRLTMVTGEAMTTVLTKHGVPIGRVNYQDNGNWSVFKVGGPQLHYHLYGRSINAVIQKYGEALSFPHKDVNPGFYSDLKPLTIEDTIGIREEMNRLFTLDRYADKTWRL